MKRNIKYTISNRISIIAILIACFMAGGCSKGKSYSELLKEEEQAVNWFLADHKICLEIPADGNFEVGEDAPYYKMDEDGYVYMQVLNPGDPDSKPEEGDVVYFRFKRCNIKYLYAGEEPVWVGNADNADASVANTSFVFGNKTLSSTTMYGEGIQVPLEYLGYNSEVNLVIKSPEGLSSDISQCIPYIYNVKYFKAEY